MASDQDPNIFGWGLFQALYGNDFDSKIAVIIAWTHFNLIKYGFQNAGIGQDPALPAQKDLKETLPAGWNNQLPCRLRYFYDKKLYFLTILSQDDQNDVIINLNRPCDNKTSISTVNEREIVTTSGSLDEIMPQWQRIMQRLTNELIRPMVEDKFSKDIHVQTESAESREPEQGQPSRLHQTQPDASFNDPPMMPFLPPFLGRPQVGGVGSADLDPLGGGGGMLFQPPGMGPRPFMPDPLLPRGAVPPGARFDPIMPGRRGIPDPSRPNPNRQPGNYPDPDHLPPPGYDDMFS